MDEHVTQSMGAGGNMCSIAVTEDYLKSSQLHRLFKELLYLAAPKQETTRGQLLCRKIKFLRIDDDSLIHD